MASVGQKWVLDVLGGVGDNTIEEDVVGGISCGWVGKVWYTEMKRKGG